MTASRKKKSIIRIVAAAAVAAVLFGAMFAARKMIAGSRSVPVISVMNIADTWIDTGSYGYGQISQGGTQQVWNDRSLLISAIYVSEGDHVSRGDALMQYDVTQARLQEDSCRIEYEMAQRDLGKARDRLAYIRTFRPNTRPEPLRMLYPETVDITRDEDGKLLVVSGKESVEEEIKDGVYGVVINVNPGTQITRRTFETLLSYDPDAILPRPDDVPEEDGKEPDDPVPPGTDVPEVPGEDPGSGEEIPGEGSEPGEGGQDEGDPGGDDPDHGGDDGHKEVIPQMNFMFVIWDHYEGMDSVRIATVSSNPEENGVPRKRWLETVMPRKEKEGPEQPGEGGEEVPAPVPSGDEEKEEPVYAFSSVYAVDGMSGSITEKVPELESEVFFFRRERANVQVPEPERYTREEINLMLAEQSRLVREMEIDEAQAALDWKKARQTATDGVVRAAHDGVVISVGNPYSGQGDEPLIQVSSGEGYQMISTISEYQLADVHAGDEISVTMWSNGMTYTGRILKISPYPASYSMSYSGGGSTSYYQYTAELDCEDELQPWDGGEIRLGEPSETSGIFAIQTSFVREEGGRSYVLRVGEDERLVKQYVETGRILYGGWSVEITGGLSLDDYIAFPYGKSAVEGAKPDYDSEVMKW